MGEEARSVFSRPQKGWFRILLAVYFVWMGILLVMYFKTVRPQRLQHAAPTGLLPMAPTSAP